MQEGMSHHIGSSRDPLFLSQCCGETVTPISRVFPGSASAKDSWEGTSQEHHSFPENLVPAQSELLWGWGDKLLHSQGSPQPVVRQAHVCC